MPRSHYNVAPRYTSGSPAAVDETTALHVAAQELDAYDRNVSGRYGIELKDAAQRKGLKGIVELRTERAGCWVVEDLLTNDKFLRAFPHTTERMMSKLSAKYNLPVEPSAVKDLYDGFLSIQDGRLVMRARQVGVREPQQFPIVTAEEYNAVVSRLMHGTFQCSSSVDFPEDEVGVSPEIVKLCMEIRS